LLCVIAYVLRFVDALKGRHVEGECLVVSVSEIKRAESMWICTVQQDSFERELNSLLIPSGARPLLIDQFGLCLDKDKLLRCQGRVNNSQLSLSSKKPSLLPSKHPLVTLLVRNAHELAKHYGVSQTLALLRERYWLLKGRQVTCKVIGSCVACRGLAYTTGSPPDLPTERVSEDPPFSHTGVDFAGPLYVNSVNQSNGQEKAYVCLFTCASTCVVHLELTHDMTIDSFLLALCRFSGFRGLPATLISDNAKTFKSCSKEVTKIARSVKVQGLHQITWKFIVERAPWWGKGGEGFYEWLVHSVKCCLRKTLGRSILNFDQPSALLIEIECIMNARPLTYSMLRMTLVVSVKLCHPLT